MNSECLGRSGRRARWNWPDNANYPACVSDSLNALLTYGMLSISKGASNIDGLALLHGKGTGASA